MKVALVRAPFNLMAAKKTAKLKKSTAKKTSTAKKGRRGPRGPRSGSKTAFIMSQPLDLPAKDVVEAGKSAGHDLDVKYVYAIRSANRGKVGSSQPGTSSTPKNTAGPAGRGLNKGTGLSAAGSLEGQFARMAVDLGIARAESILRSVREQLDRMTF